MKCSAAMTAWSHRIRWDDVLVIQVGNGKRSVDDSIDVVDPVYHGEEDVMEGEGDMSGETHEPVEKEKQKESGDKGSNNKDK